MTLRADSTHSRITALLLAALAALVVLFFLAAPASAHVPVLEPDRASDAPAAADNPFPGAVPVPDASISRALYGTLTGADDFDAWLVTVSERTEAPIELLVPAEERYADLRPSFALVGEGLPTSSATPQFIAQRLQTAAGGGTKGSDQYGVVNVPDPGAAPRSTFYEPFSFTRYFEGGSTTQTLLPGRDYYLVVYDPAGGRGEYAFGVARAEQWTLHDAGAAIVAVLRIKLGLYGQGSPHPLAWAVVIGAVFAIIAAVVLVVVLIRRRRRRRLALPPAAGRR